MLSKYMDDRSYSFQRSRENKRNNCHDIFTAKISDQLKNPATTSRKKVKMQKEKIQMDIEKIGTKGPEENRSD